MNMTVSNMNAANANNLFNTALANNVFGQGQAVMMQGYSLAVCPVTVGDGGSNSNNDSNLLTSS